LQQKKEASQKRDQKKLAVPGPNSAAAITTRKALQEIKEQGY
jgi:hypothetical protein